MKYKGLNDNRVTIALGLSVGKLGKSRKENRDLSNDLTEKILNFYTDLNRAWLLAGEGEMIKNEGVYNKGTINGGLFQANGNKNINISLPSEGEQKIIRPDGTVEVYSGSDKKPIKGYIAGVPYYNVDFVGGFDLVANDQTINPEYLIDFKEYNKATCWCNITGHSMEPEINSGDIIALKDIPDASFLPFGEIYAIVTTNGMRTVKRIGPASAPDCYSLIPTNKAPEFGIQEIPKDKILKVYQVLGCMKRL